MINVIGWSQWDDLQTRLMCQTYFPKFFKVKLWSKKLSEMNNSHPDIENFPFFHATQKVFQRVLQPELLSMACLNLWKIKIS